MIVQCSRLMVKISTKMNILITGVGGPTPRNIAWSIKNCSEFNLANLFGTDINKFAIGLYQKDIYKETFLIPSAGDPSYWDKITEIVVKNDIEIALVHPELEVVEWSRRQSQGKKMPCKVLLADFHLSEVLVSKAKTTDILKDEENFVPKSYVFNRNSLDKEALLKQKKKCC